MIEIGPNLKSMIEALVALTIMIGGFWLLVRSDR